MRSSPRITLDIVMKLNSAKNLHQTREFSHDRDSSLHNFNMTWGRMLNKETEKTEGSSELNVTELTIPSSGYSLKKIGGTPNIISQSRLKTSAMVLTFKFCLSDTIDYIKR